MDLARTNQQQPLAYQPPTPPPDDDDDEAMDWTPSQENKVLPPATAYRSSNVASQPLSYREKLTAAAQSQPMNLRIPSNQSMFRKSAVMQSRESLKTPTKFTMRDSSNESPFATPYEPSLANASPDLSPIKFAQPKFFPHTDREELGLESLMAKSFSLAEEPHEVRARQRKNNATETQSKFGVAYAQWQGSAALLLLAFSLAIWTNTLIPSSTILRMYHYRLTALCIAALVILKSLLLAAREDSTPIVSKFTLLAFELITTIMLGATLRERGATSLPEDSIGPLETPGTILIAILMAQEVWMLYSGTRVRQTSIEDLPSHPVSNSRAAVDRADRQRPFAGSSSMPLPAQNPKTSTGTFNNSQDHHASSQRKTRAQTKVENDTHARGGFSGLSLGHNDRNEQELGLRSVNLGHSQRRNRNGMW